MIKQQVVYGLMGALLYLSGCSSSSDETIEVGNWIKRSSFEGVGRSGAISFVIGERAFVGLGYDGDDYLTDFWSYDPNENFWRRIADFPGVGRTSSVAFSIESTGYVGLGYDGRDELGDFWAYDVDTDTWSQPSDFGGSARLAAVGFASNGKGYVGSGYDGNYLKDFWEFDPDSGTWAQIVSYKGEKRNNAVSFVIDGNGYVVTGTNNGLFQMDFWGFDQTIPDWFQNLDIDEDDDYFIAREKAVAFSLDGIGYITTGTNGSNMVSTWSYDPVFDLWEERTSFEGSSRQGAVGFTVAGRSFVALGQNSSSRFDDVWEFRPNELYDEED